MSAVGLIIPAAGASSRMGMPKQLLDFGATSLLGNAITAASNSVCGPIVVVLGAYAVQVGAEVNRFPMPVYTIINGQWSEGLSSSIREGVSCLTNLQSDLEAVVIMTCDQPFITSDII